MRKLCSHCLECFETENEKVNFCPICREKVKVLTCKDCGEEFDISFNEENHFLSEGLNLPKRCRPCRNIRKEKNRILDLSPHIGKKIKRIAPSQYGDRSYLGDIFILRKIEGKDLIVEYIKSSFLHDIGETERLEGYNDGYWKIGK